MDENQGHQEETHRPTHRFKRLFPGLILIGSRECTSAMRVIELPSSCSSPKTLYVINSYITTYAVDEFLLWIISNSVTLLSSQCFFTVVDRWSIMTRIHWRSVMVYGSLQAEFMGTKGDGHWCGTHIFGDIIVHIFEPINNDNQIPWRL